MEWLKEILEKAKVTEEGKIDVESVMDEINKEFPLHAVPKNTFNDKVQELKTANDTITELKKSNKDNEDLQNKVGEYEKEVQKLKKEAENTSKTYALKEQMSKAGVIDPDYIIYKAGGIDKFTFDKDNKPIGVEESIKAYKEDATMKHLFREEHGTGYNPKNGGVGGNTNPFAKESYNLTKQGELLKSNPEQARAMAAAAGVTI